MPPQQDILPTDPDEVTERVSLFPSRALSDVEDADTAMVVDGRYRVESEIGRGGMGIVYRARDTWLDRPVALKMIAPIWADSTDALMGLQREAKALASVRSQFVVQVFAFGVHDTSYFFAMEYVQGGTLRQILEDHCQHGDPIPVHRTVTILDRIAQGLSAVHAAGIVHRDVKPANIVIEERTGRPVLVDFGLATPSHNHADAMSIGTPQYMAPEQAGVGPPGALVSAATDIYSLGITAFEMFTGQLPFDVADHVQLMRQHARKKPRLVSSICPALVPFNNVISRALAKNPDDRHETAAEFAGALAEAAARWDNSRVATLQPPPPERVPVAALSALSSGGTQPVHILAVDDSSVFRRFTGKAAQLAFFRQRKDLHVVLEGAGSGTQAVLRARLQIPDLLLLDFDMPGINGVGTLSELRALPGGDRIRVVVISGRVTAEDRWRFAVLGVNDFVAKPIEFEQLVERIEAIAIRWGMVPKIAAG